MAFKEVDVSGGAKIIKSEQVAFENKGDLVEGHLIDRATLTSKTDGKQFKKYTIKTTKGTVSFLGGYQLDKGLSEDNAPLGALVRVTYKGSKKLEGGRKMKEFSIQVDEDDLMDISESPESILAASRV